MSQNNTCNTQMYSVLLTVATVMYLILYIPLVHYFIGACSLTANHIISLLVMLAFATIVYVIILLLSFRAYDHHLHHYKMGNNSENLDSIRKSMKEEVRNGVSEAMKEYDQQKQAEIEARLQAEKDADKQANDVSSSK